ncbi:unnamed protein product, partial [Coregonus sp. 'balchen']
NFSHGEVLFLPFCLLYVLVRLITGQLHLRTRMGSLETHNPMGERRESDVSVLGSSPLSATARAQPEINRTSHPRGIRSRWRNTQERVRLPKEAPARLPTVLVSGLSRSSQAVGSRRGGRNPARDDVSLPVRRQVSASRVRSEEITHGRGTNQARHEKPEASTQAPTSGYVNNTEGANTRQRAPRTAKAVDSITSSRRIPAPESNASPTALSALSDNGVDSLTAPAITRSQPQQSLARSPSNHSLAAPAIKDG